MEITRLAYYYSRWPVSLCDIRYREMPPKRAVSAKEKGAKKTNAGGDEKSHCAGLTVLSAPSKPTEVDEGTKEYYLVQIRDLEYRVAR